MSHPDCTRYMQARDRELLDEPIGDLDRRFCQRHEQSCAVCSREAAVWAEVEGNLQKSVASGDATLERVVFGHVPHGAARAHARARLQRGLAWAAAACVLVGVAAAGGFRMAGSASAAAQVTRGKLASAGQPYGVGSVMEESSRLRAIGGEACVVVSGGVELCLDSDAELALTDLEGAHRRVALTSGRVTAKLEKQPPGARFSVITAAGEVTAIGTVFTVELTPDGPALVEVEEGTVEVRSQGVPTLRVQAHEKLEVGSTRVLSMREDAVMPPRAADRVARSAANEPSQKDAVEVPQVLPPSERILAPSERIHIPRPAEKLPTAAERLASARVLRARGEAAAAAREYRALQRVYPNSGEAMTSYVSLGQLELTELGNAAAALQAFQAYLKRGGGSLSHEAEHGRIRALHALGKVVEARRESAAFLQRYPSSPHAPSLRRQLAAAP